MIDTIKRTKKQFLVRDEEPAIGIVLESHDSLAPGLESMSDGANYALLKQDFKSWYKLFTLTILKEQQEFDRLR